ncbi:RidA family protein [Afifella pfennigii]|uniref:RidA family protein n=1 Tax=Afifella pfennigii TaxID=209897 RepID=UPI000AC05711|nr:RidA family protein [Afifella pfennigii]
MIERIGVDPNTPLPLAPAVRAGDFVFLSGQAALDETGTIISGNIAAQTELTIQRIIAVLEQCGLTLDDVVKTTVWLDDARDFGAFNKVYAKHFGKAPPARSTVVSPLVVDGKIEIEVVAYAPKAA